MSEVGGEGTDRLRGRGPESTSVAAKCTLRLTTDGQREGTLPSAFGELETKLWSVFDSLENISCWLDG